MHSENKNKKQQQTNNIFFTKNKSYSLLKCSSKYNL